MELIKNFPNEIENLLSKTIEVKDFLFINLSSINTNLTIEEKENISNWIEVSGYTMGWAFALWMLYHILKWIGEDIRAEKIEKERKKEAEKEAEIKKTMTKLFMGIIAGREVSDDEINQ